MSDIAPDDVQKVWEYLKTRANAEPKQLVYFSDIERKLGRELYSSQWHLLLDPIYEEVKLRQGKPDLTCIVVFKEGDKREYPPCGSLLLAWLRLATSSSARFGAASPT